MPRVEGLVASHASRPLGDLVPGALVYATIRSRGEHVASSLEQQTGHRNASIIAKQLTNIVAVAGLLVQVSFHLARSDLAATAALPKR